MKYRKEERLDIARRVYDREMTVGEAAIKFDISPDTVKGYLRLYRTETGLPPMNRGCGASLLRNAMPLGGSSLKEYEGMTREELLNGLVMARINEARLKKGYCVKGICHELTLYMNLWNNEILAHSLSSKRGDRMTHLSGLRDLIGLKGHHPQYRTIHHTDQGAVYASKAFNELLPMYGITRSMSRAGTPTDNAAAESING